jgi:hypothetical protein
LKPLALNFDPAAVRGPLPAGFWWQNPQGFLVCAANSGFAIVGCGVKTIVTPAIKSEATPATIPTTTRLNAEALPSLIVDLLGFVPRSIMILNDLTIRALDSNQSRATAHIQLNTQRPP